MEEKQTFREMKHPSLIFLTGFSGSGKSTIGPLLANSLGYDFLDMDREIESRAGKTINDIFAEHGEGYFRELELNLLRTIVDCDRLVVSLGGGMLQNDRCFSLVSSSGTLVYLYSEPAILARRLSHKIDRPLMKGPGGERLPREQIEQKILDMLKEREPRYRSARLTVETGSKRLGTTVEELTRKIERHVRRSEQHHRADRNKGPCSTG